MEFRGWRRYSLRLEGGRMSLWGVREKWESPVLTAKCFYYRNISECPMETEQEAEERNRIGRPPYIGWHGCGIHSFKTLEDLLGEFGAVLPREVVAEVVNYGRVDEFEHGYRAEHTRILKMYLIAGKDSQADFMEALRRILETRFGVPVVVTSLADLIAEHAPDYKEPQYGSHTLIPSSGAVSYSSGSFWNGVTIQWQTSASASSATTTSPNRSQRRSGSPPPSSNPSPSNDDHLDAAARVMAAANAKPKKKPVEDNLPANKKKWWLKR